MKKIILVVGICALAFVILFISIFDSSSITYSLSKAPNQPIDGPNVPEISYTLPYTGRVLPDSPFWGLKALRDKVWFGITSSHLRRAQLALLFADKRIVMSVKLFEKGEPEIAVSTYTKGEKYLAIAVDEELLARTAGMDTSSFLERLATSALKHKQISEDLMRLAPEDARPLIAKTENYAEDAFEAARNALNSKGLPVPNNPFDGE